MCLQTLRSEPAEAKTFPFGLNLEHRTSDAWPSNSMIGDNKDDVRFGLD